MKKFINIITIVFFLSPVFAMADSVSWNSSSGPVGSNPTFNASISSGNAFILYDQSGNSNPPNVWEGAGTFTNDSLVDELTAWGAIGSIGAYNGTVGSITIAAVSPYNGGNANICTVYADCVSGGWVTQSSVFNFIVPHVSTIGDIIDNSTTSVESVTGFGMNSMALWMWESLGKPIAGSGLAVLYTLRWYLMTLIAMAIIIFFAFKYRAFFKH